MIAEIIASGSEMLTPFRQDTNSLYLTEQLNNIGVQVAFKTVVGDSLDHLTAVLRNALSRVDIVLLSGGLGPTEDDLTREAVAAALGRTLYRDATLLEGLAARFAARGIPMPTNNLRQAEIIDGATILHNAHGSAPGQFIDATLDGNRRIVILLPGPPSELKPLFHDVALPVLAPALPPRHIARRLLRMALIPESSVDARTAPIYKPCPGVQTTILSGHGEIQLHFIAAADTAEDAQSRVDDLAARIQQEMGDFIFSSHGESLEDVVLLGLRQQQLSLATAESCTGGLLAERLTAIPNSSSVFRGGVVAYTAETKTLFCDVSPDDLQLHGAVSAEAARAMAEGIRRRTGSSLGIGITGLAGPSGGAPGPDEAKPVGLVYIALAGHGETRVKELRLPGDRARVRLWATQHALEMIRYALLERASAQVAT